MLGIYDNFPENIHKIANFAVSVSGTKLQENLIRVFNETNRKTFNLEDVADPSVPNCTTIFELGIAEANDFNYLDDEEASTVLKAVEKKPFQVMDFYCAVRYYKSEGEKKAPLKFDYYMIRAIFNKNSLETRVFHERGPRYTSPDDIVDFLTEKINEKFSRKILKVSETL